MLELNKLYNMDCMEGMRQFPDKFFELAIVDPPYGGGGQGSKAGMADPACTISASRTGGAWAGKYQKDIRQWDFAPPKEYFEELARVSVNQVVWGGNYFALPPTRCFLVWRKLTISERFSMAMAEYAWTSFNGNAKVYECAPQGTRNEPRFHPTQKPVSLYKWVLGLFAKKGDRVIDTHAGSASSLVACHDMGFDHIGFEINKHYYDMASRRLAENKMQVRLDI